jgi:hypothetical protein
MSAVNEWKRRLRKLGYPDTPRAERRIPPGFAARKGSDSTAEPAAIHDISSTGFYLLTQERWPLGELTLCTIQIATAPPGGSDAEFAIEVRVIRHGNDGIGLSFVLPPGVDPHLWELLIEKSATLRQQEGIEFMFKMLRAVLFLCRICLAEAHYALQLFGGELDEARTATALQIAIGAEKLLALEPGADKMHAHPELVANLLKFGSWAIGSLTRQLWAGLLATSCTEEGGDRSNQEFLDLLVNVTPTQGLIFVVACNKAREVMTESEGHPSTRIIFSPEEMKQLTGKTDLTRVATDIAYLFHSGLVERNFDFTSYIPTENFDITPAPLGMELYRKCKGHLADAQSVMGKVEGA